MSKFWRLLLIVFGVFVAALLIPPLLPNRFCERHVDLPHLELVTPPARAPNLRDNPAVARTLTSRAEGPALPPDAEALARSLNAPDESPEHDVQTLTSLVDLFRRANYDAIPAGGLNEEITSSC